jgi:hypothetical protein
MNTYCRPLYNSIISGMQTKKQPVQNMHPGENQDACFEQVRFFPLGKILKGNTREPIANVRDCHSRGQGPRRGSGNSVFTRTSGPPLSRLSQKGVFMSSPRKRGPRYPYKYWIPAFAGMTDNNIYDSLFRGGDTIY